MQTFEYHKNYRCVNLKNDVKNQRFVKEYVDKNMAVLLNSLLIYISHDVSAQLRITLH